MNKLAYALKSRLPRQFIQSLCAILCSKAHQAQSDHARSQLPHLLAAGDVYKQVHVKHQAVAWIAGQACFHADTKQHSVTYLIEGQVADVSKSLMQSSTLACMPAHVMCQLTDGSVTI